MEEKSEFVRKAEEAIEAIDKLVRDAVRDMEELVEKAKELKDLAKDRLSRDEPD